MTILSAGSGHFVLEPLSQFAAQLVDLRALCRRLVQNAARPFSSVQMLVRAVREERFSAKASYRQSPWRTRQGLFSWRLCSITVPILTEFIVATRCMHRLPRRRADSHRNRSHAGVAHGHLNGLGSEALSRALGRKA
jgi:hypothetical protein